MPRIYPPTNVFLQTFLGRFLKPRAPDNTVSLKVHFRERFKEIPPRQWLFTTVLPMVLLGIVAWAFIYENIPIGDMTRDVAAIGHIHPLAGFLSNIGILLWCATTAICTFSAYLIDRTKSVDAFRFLIASTLLTAYLLLDDLFQIHDHLAPSYLGITEKPIFLILACSVTAYLFAFRNLLMKTRFPILMLSLALFACSLFVDRYQRRFAAHLGEWEHFLEDGFKWLGIVSWFSFHTVCASHFVRLNFQKATHGQF